MEDKRRTTKKVKVVGQVEYLNTSTGELETMNVTTVEERDFNFTKVWLTDLMSKLGIISNSKTKFAYWFLDNLNRENMVTMTYRQLADKSGYSYKVVSQTMQALIGANFVVKVNSGCYMVNPDVLFKGAKNTRQNLLIQYNDTVKRNKDTEETKLAEKINQLARYKSMLQNIAKDIARLEDEIQSATMKASIEANGEAS